MRNLCLFLSHVLTQSGKTGSEIKHTCIEAIALSLSLSFCSCSLNRTDFGSRINLATDGCGKMKCAIPYLHHSTIQDNEIELPHGKDGLPHLLTLFLQTKAAIIKPTESKAHITSHSKFGSCNERFSAMHVNIICFKRKTYAVEFS